MALFDKFEIKKDQSADLKNVIVNNLVCVLNSQRGYGFFRKRFGITGFQGLTNYNLLAVNLRNQIRGCMNEFEPRFLCKSIKEIDTSGDLSKLFFSVAGCISEKNIWFDLIFDTSLNKFSV